MTSVPKGRISFSNILCPVDLSEPSRHALDHAQRLAAWYRAKLDVVVVRPFVLTAVEEPEIMAKELAEFSAPPSGASIQMECHVVEGPTIPEILKLAAAEHADLIVLGTHGRTGFDRLLVGSVTEAILRKAPCPVLTIPPRSVSTSRVQYRHIVCATDFSPASRIALDYALSLAQADDARLCLLHVNEWPAYPPAWYESAVKADALREAVLNSARAELASAVPAQAREWCRVEERVVTGRPHEEIVRIAGELEADLIVMGVHGRAAVTDAIFGSTTNQVVRHATCPVLSVRK